ncbi:uncharacterized protein LOC126971740 [Leptidea sinapis]|uniref:uncharacterized protein LOC126971740 n=1 Tax=Leptidea sinapis TaxID=189913 RepID=UPI00213749BB|nr:uncharacterized protein LOC126971740 [Leptidea sinapis]XP_050674082.1 uncharacterized protein LOC126971740 [Leptidea sinapis]
MAVPHITSFCWCMGLEAGTKLIGFLHLALSFGLMVFSSVYAARFGELVGTAEDAGDRLYRTWYIISVAVAVFSAAHLLLAATLLVAVFNRHSRLLRGYVWAMLALYVASVLYVLVSMAFGFSVTGSDIFIAFVEGVLFFGILAYCILCVNSYYLMLKSTEDMEGPSKTDY